MSELVTDLRIVSSEHNIFDTDTEYTIPLYQRAYAWEDKQLIQLVEDISDASIDANYYIGALIVSRQGNKFEVVDGQQRLTSLYLLLNCLGLEVRHTLTFACREKSNYTLKHIRDLLQDNRSAIEEDRIELNIQRGLNILKEELKKPEYNKADLLKKLERVVLFRIEVPENTDLNRYFEIMNTRGEQLEQHDILKAMLMSNLPDSSDKNIFAKIWDACSDMTGYVQMHFISKDNAIRANLFGGGWNCMPPEKWEAYRNRMQLSAFEGTNQKITDIICADDAEPDDGYNDDDVRVRFESVIEFPFFLIHTLKVLIALKGIRHEDGTSAIIAELLDDKKLVESFERVIKFGITDTGKISENTEQFSKDFIICLLRSRYLFDKYIVKREYANENSDGDWSLKSLEVSDKKPYYKNTKFPNKSEWYQDRKNPVRVKENIMIQSALRVSYTSPKVMHWITELLKWLFNEDHLQRMADYSKVAESIAKAAVVNDFFNKCPDGRYDMGVNTPHIVFNYLDYLLWRQEKKYSENFVFEFRNSVEHWYPQNPSEGTFETWKDGVDRFGNLCIIQRNVNSKFSNMSPEAKKSTFRAMIAKGSIKLRIMSDLTERTDGIAASVYWKDTMVEVHEQKMITLLKAACGIADEKIVV